MDAGKKEFLCSACRKRVSYHILKRPARVFIKDLEIEYEEYYGVCDQCRGEMYVPGLDDQNEARIEAKYREAKGLITIPEVKNIMEKYHIEKRPLSKLMGFGELTITRYLDGQLPSKRYSDILFQVLNDSQYMKNITEENKNLVSAVTVKKVFQAIENYDKEKIFNNSAERIALYVINYGKEITNLLLQKILYYVKGISYLYQGSFMINEPCEAWKFGPVFPTVYEKYKGFGKQEITLKLSDEYVSGLLTEEEKHITDFVLDTIGIYNAWFLKDLTHMEEPWRAARNGMDENDTSRNIMDDKLIMDYFQRMNESYHLKTPGGIELYVNDMKKKIFS